MIGYLMQSGVDRFRRPFLGIAGVFGLFAMVYLLGLAMLRPIIAAGVEPATDPGDPHIGLWFVLALLVVTAGMLVAFRWGLGHLIRGFVVLVAMGMTMLVLEVLLPAVLVVRGLHAPAVAGAVLVWIALVRHPRWYVLDIAGILIGAAAVALFGLTLGVFPAILFLVLLAVYDAISVYGTKHMLSLAEGAMESRLPVVLIVPLSVAAMHRPPRDDISSAERDRVVVGLGDAIIPGMLVGSAVVHGPGSLFLLAGVPLTVPAAGALVGIALGVCGLFVLLSRGGAHPGLPLLNAGAIGGYLVAAVLHGVPALQAVGVT